MPNTPSSPEIAQSNQPQPSKNVHRLLPDWLNAHRAEIDAAITRVLNTFRPEIREMAEDAASRGRKLRGTLSLQLIEWSNWQINEADRVNLLTDIARIEILHSMSCVLDDIIDGDDVRRGTPAFHVRQNSKAVALLLPLLFATDFAEYEGFKNMTSQVITGELFDAHLLAKHGIDHFKDPVTEYLQKSAPPFAHSHMVAAKHSNRSESEIEAAKKYGTAIGKYYQAANDHHDCFTIPQDVRGDMEELVPLNFSIPFYLYWKKNPEFAKKLGTEVSREELAQIVAEMKKANIEKESRKFVRNLRKEIETNFPGETFPPELRTFLNLVNTPQFWSYQYRLST